MDKDSVETVLNRYETFCIAGGEYSLGHLSNRLKELGKEFSYVTSPSAEALKHAPDFECLIICGPTTQFETSKPVASIMGGASGSRMVNVDEASLSGLNFRGELASCPVDYWYNLTKVNGQSRNIELCYGVTTRRCERTIRKS